MMDMSISPTVMIALQGRSMDHSQTRQTRQLAETVLTCSGNVHSSPVGWHMPSLRASRRWCAYGSLPAEDEGSKQAT